MNKPFKEKGFTLIEMIIAVALLAIAGTAAATLFMTAQTNNLKARDLDKSTALLSTWVEEIKASPESWVNGRPMNAAIQPGNGKSSFKAYYNKDWLPVSNENEISGTAEYVVTIDLFEVPDKDGLWTVETRSVKIKPYFLGSGGDIEILKISSMAEYPGEVAP